MELSLRIYLIFGISFCIAAPSKNEDSVSKCINNANLSTVQRDILKNCHYFKTLKRDETLYSTNAENNTLCALYYNSLSAYCHLNTKLGMYPALQDIRQNNDVVAICKNITPNLKTVLKNSNLVTCYSLCSQLSGDIRPECLYANYYLNLTHTERHINEVATSINTSVVSHKTTVMPGNTVKESSNTAASTNTSSHEEGQENPPAVGSPVESNSNTANRDREEPLTNNISPHVNDHEDLIHDNPPELPLNAEKKDNKPKNVAADTDKPPITTPKANIKPQSQGVEEHPAVVSPIINNDENENVNQIDDKEISDPILDNPSNNANNDDTEYSIDNNNNTGDRTQQQDDANNGFEESVDTAAKLEDEKEIIDQKEEKKPHSVQDSPVDSENIDDIDGESYFFSYFMVICVLFILGYVGYHNRIKVMALLLEGKRGKRQYRGRRPNSANYHKLDTNLEEAISSNVTKNSNNVIF